MSVPNLILLSASLPISNAVFTTEVIPVCAASKLTAPLDTEKNVSLNDAMPLLEVEAFDPAIVTSLPDAEVSIPVPPVTVKVSLSRSIAIVPLSVVKSKSCAVT